MNIAKQIVDNQVMNLLKANPQYFTDKFDEERKKSKAFLLLAVSAYLETDITDAVQYITDNSNDGGFDAAYITEEQESQISVIFFQAKYTRDLEKDSNFPSNAVEKAVNTIKNVFDPGRQMELNAESQKIVTDIHSYLLDGYIPLVTFVCVNNGLMWNGEAQTHIDNNFKGQKQVRFEYFNHDDIFTYTTKIKGVDTPLQFKGRAVREDFNYKSVILGRVCVTEIHKLMSEHGDILLEKNIRKFLGRNAINEGIRNTLEKEDKRNNFFFFNNGITIVCRKFSANYLQESNWCVKTENLQIINGGQTCRTIFQTVNDNPGIDFSNVDVLVRLYEVSSDVSVIQDITFATNSQNPVDFRDLQSNSKEQILLEEGAKQLNYVYKRKRDMQPPSPPSFEAIPSSVAAESVLAVWRGYPHIAKYKKGEFFSTYYNIIFSDLNAAQMIMAVLIFRFCDNYRRKEAEDPELQAFRPYGQYFISAVIGRQLLLKTNIMLDQLTHKNFSEVKGLFDQNKEPLYRKSEEFLLQCLHDYMHSDLTQADGRTVAAMFRRFDIVERYIKKCPLLF